MSNIIKTVIESRLKQVQSDIHAESIKLRYAESDVQNKKKILEVLKLEEVEILQFLGEKSNG